MGRTQIKKSVYHWGGHLFQHIPQREPGRIREECSFQRAVQSHVKGRWQDLYPSWALSSSPAGPQDWPGHRGHPPFKRKPLLLLPCPCSISGEATSLPFGLRDARSRGAALDAVNVRYSFTREESEHTGASRAHTHSFPPCRSCVCPAGRFTPPPHLRTWHESCSDQGRRREGAVCLHQRQPRRRRWCSCSCRSCYSESGPQRWLLHQSCVPRGAAREPG